MGQMDIYLTPVTQTSVKKTFANSAFYPRSTEVYLLDPRVGARTPPRASSCCVQPRTQIRRGSLN